MYICTYTYILTFIHRTARAAARGAGLARHATSASSRARTAESLPTTAANAFVRRGTRASTAAQILTSQYKVALCSTCTRALTFETSRQGGGFTTTGLAGCAGESKNIAISWKFGGDAPAPTKNSFIALYKIADTNPFAPTDIVYMCGNDKDAKGAKCPNTGSAAPFKNKMPTEAGEYKIALVEYQPPNEFGQDGYPTKLKDDMTIARLTVLPANKCDEAAVKAAIDQNSPLTILNKKIAVIKAEEASQQAAEDARLDVADPLIEKLKDAPAGSAHILKSTLYNYYI
jgi:hypothetical protein